MKIHYQLVTEQDLLIQKGTGQWNTNEFEEFSRHISSIPEWTNIKKILFDLRDITIHDGQKQIDDFIAIRQKYNPVNRDVALLINQPETTVTAILYQQEVNKLGENLSVISTIEKCLRFLRIAFSKTELAEILNNLAHSNSEI